MLSSVARSLTFYENLAVNDASVRNQSDNYESFIKTLRDLSIPESALDYKQHSALIPYYEDSEESHSEESEESLEPPSDVKMPQAPSVNDWLKSALERAESICANYFGKESQVKIPETETLYESDSERGVFADEKEIIESESELELEVSEELEIIEPEFESESDNLRRSKRIRKLN